MEPNKQENEKIVDITEPEQPDKNLGITGGKRKSKRHGNASLRGWVAFVKKVQKEEKLSYRDAMMRAKVRKDKGEKWMGGGSASASDPHPGVQSTRTTASAGRSYHSMKGGLKPQTFLRGGGEGEEMEGEEMIFEDKQMDDEMEGGRRRRRSRRRRTQKRRGSKKRRHTRRR